MAGKYWAFISYSHADENVARWLHRALETYQVPKRLRVRSGSDAPRPGRLFPVFRDREELASAATLSDSINAALAQSHALIVIASPRSAQSHWVNEEILRYKAMGHGQVFCVIAEGEPFARDPEQECFAPALRFEVTADGKLTDTPAEPLAADLRPGKDGKRDGLLKLIAGILGVGLDELKQRDQQRRQRRLVAIATLGLLASVMTSTLAVFAVKARDEARAQRGLAEQRQHQAEGLIQLMLGDLRKKLEPIGKLDILDAVGEQALSYFAAVDPKNLSDVELSAQARALRQIGDVRLQQGNIETATPVFRQALALDEEKVRRDPDDADMLFNLAQSEYYMGARYYNAGDFEQAEPWWERYKASADRLVALDDSNAAWLQEVSHAFNNLLLLAFQRGHWSRCVQLGVGTEKFNEQFAQQFPASAEMSLSRSESLNSWSLCLESLGEIDRAVSVSRRHLQLRRAMIDKTPEDSTKQWLLAIALDSTAQLERKAGNLEAAVDLGRQSISVLNKLRAHDPTNAEWAFFFSIAIHHAAEAEILRDNVDEARRLLSSALSVNQSLAELDYKRLRAIRNLIREYALIYALDISEQRDGLGRQDVADAMSTLISKHAVDDTVTSELAIGCAVLTLKGMGRESCAVVNQAPLANADAVTANLVAEMRQAVGVSGPTPPTLNAEQTRMLKNSPHWVLLRRRQAAAR